MFRCEATLQVPLKHHANVEGRPGRRPLAHLFLEGIHVMARVFDFLIQHLTPGGRGPGTTDEVRTIQVVGPPGMSFGSENDGSSLGNVAHIHCGNAQRAQRHGVDAGFHQGILEPGVILDEVVGTNDGKFQVKIMQRAFQCEL